VGVGVAARLEQGFMHALQDGQMTVYTVRLTTSFERGSALSEPFAGVSVCLISEDGRGVLRRISPVNDPQENKKAVEDICSVSSV
jgi:hypothetical protein